MTTTDYAAQLSLPGQTHVAEGPHDQTGMYLAHHAFRRDLANFEAATQNTPIDARDTWQALVRRWAGFSMVLHHHHETEDVHIWPVLVRHVQAAGDTASMQLLDAMEAEHGQIDPALSAVEQGLASMVHHPSAENRAAVAAHAAAAHSALLHHLRHEETEAIPLLQRMMTTDEFAASEKAALEGYRFRDLTFLVPWALTGLPEDTTRGIVAKFGTMYDILRRLTRGRFARLERRAFCYV